MTLLPEWARARQASGAAVAWYSLDTGDDEPVAFGSYLVASLLQALGSGPGRPLPALTNAARILHSAPAVDLQPVLPAVINAVGSSEQECLLVIDDYHLIAAPAVHSAVAFLIEHLPRTCA